MPTQQPAGYSGTPLPRKLGIKIGSAVALLNAPADFAETLGDLPVGATLAPRTTKSTFLVLWFVKDVAQLEKSVDKVAAAAPAGGLWICWPKKASGIKTDINENIIREAGLARGLVDYKVCAVDATWSGLKFAKRSD